jgi:hypothetical protein
VSGRFGRRAAVLAGVLLVLALFEGVARRVSWLVYDIDPRLGSILAPDRVQVYCREGCGSSRWIADGIRRVAPLDPARPVLLVLGDSFTESLMIDDDRVFTRLLEAKLAAAGSPLQVANAGRSGGSPADYVALAPFYRARLAPRWTVIQIRAPDLEGDAFDPSKTHFDEQPDGRLALVPVVQPISRFNRALAPLRRESALVGFATIRLREFRSAAADEAPLFRATRRRAPPPARAWPVTAQLAAMADAFDGRVTFLFLPDYDAGDPDYVDAIEHTVAQDCAAHGWSCASLRDAFPAFAAARTAPYGFPNSAFNSGHMNDAGHAAAAAVLETELRRVLARDLL